MTTLRKLLALLAVFAWIGLTGCSKAEQEEPADTTEDVMEDAADTAEDGAEAVEEMEEEVESEY